jgi:hypothetical protein
MQSETLMGFTFTRQQLPMKTLDVENSQGGERMCCRNSSILTCSTVISDLIVFLAQMLTDWNAYLLPVL